MALVYTFNHLLRDWHVELNFSSLNAMTFDLIDYKIEGCAGDNVANFLEKTNCPKSIMFSAFIPKNLSSFSPVQFS